MSRKSPEERKIACEAVLRLGSGLVAASHVRGVASAVGVTERTLYRWLREEATNSPVRDDPAGQSRFEVDAAMVTVVAQEQSLLAGHKKLVEAGIIDVSYATFCRAMDRIDPAVLHGAMSGRKEMAANRVYLKRVVPHRCHTYFLDHTQLDIHVLPTHKHTTPVRPHLTVIGDAYSGYLWAFVWYRKPDGTAIAAALASTCIEQTIDGVSVGGVPQQLMLDNAAEHFAEDMRRSCTALGIVVSPTSVYSSWQNGKGERAVQLVNRLVTADAPGAIRVGTDKSSTRFLETERRKTDPANLWSAAALEAKVRQVLAHINGDIRMKDRGGLTRLELFTQHPTERDFLSEEAARLVSMRADKDTYRASKSGVRFRNRHYVSADISPKRQYKVRHLPGVVDFIELFDVDDKYVTRAYNQETLPKAERNRILAARARSERDVRAVEEGVKQHRRHAAALDNAGVVDDAVNLVDTHAYEELPMRDPEVDQSPKRKLPRVPVTAPTKQDVEATNRRHEEVMTSPEAQAILAEVASLNAAREAKKKEANHDN